MSVISMKELLEAGVHFGHRSRRWHPKMRSYIFTERNGIHIIDLQQTIVRLEEAYNFVRDTVAEGGVVLFVGTKKQAQDSIKSQADRCGMPYVAFRWLGGTLTNFRTIRQRTDHMIELEEQKERNEFARLTKREALGKERELAKLQKRFGGVRNMRRLPDAIFITDIHREAIAVEESNTLTIPIVAMVDTNCDPDPIDYVVPSNDDAIRAIKLLTSKMADAVVEGQQMRGVMMADDGKEGEMVETLATEAADEGGAIAPNLPRVFEPEPEEDNEAEIEQA